MWWSWECGVWCYDNGYCESCDNWWYDSDYDKGVDCTPEYYFGWTLDSDGNWAIVSHYTDCPDPKFKPKPKKPKQMSPNQAPVSSHNTTYSQYSNNTGTNNKDYYNDEYEEYCYEC